MIIINMVDNQQKIILTMALTRSSRELLILFTAISWGMGELCLSQETCQYSGNFQTNLEILFFVAKMRPVKHLR